VTRPTCEQLVHNPELASLALLEVALDIASLALAAVWPELHEIEMANEHDEPRAALEILQLSGDLSVAIEHYKRVLGRAHALRSDTPF